MRYGMDHLEQELAGIATRLEQLERDRASEKLLASRTPSGLLVPKNVTVAAVNPAVLDARLDRLTDAVDGLRELVHRMAKVQAQHQGHIEELSLMAIFPVD